MKHVAIIALLGLTLSVMPAVAAAPDPPCEGSELLVDCLNSILDSHLDPSPLDPALAARAPNTAKAQTTPSDTPGTDGVLRTFLPQILSGLGFQGVKDTNGSLTFEVPLSMGNGIIKPSLTGVIAKPELFKALVDKIPASIREARKKTLESQLGDLDQVDLRFALAYEPKVSGTNRWNRWGRDPDDYQPLIDEIVTKIEGNLGSPLLKLLSSPAFRGATDDAIRQRQVLQPGAPVDENTLTVNDLREEAKSFLKRFSEAAAQEREALDKLAADINSTGEKLGQLISAQPQAFVEYVRAERDELTGPRKDSYKLCFEFGLRNNVNDFLEWGNDEKNGCMVSNGIPDFDCLLTYSTNEKKRKAIDRSWRFVVMGQYEDAHQVNFSLPDDNFEFEQPGKRTWSVTAGAGRQLRNFAIFDAIGGSGGNARQGKELRPSRIDFTAKIDLDTSRDIEKREVYTLTFSQPMSDNSVLSLAVAYANHPEFLGDVDENLSARLGFTVKRDKPKS